MCMYVFLEIYVDIKYGYIGIKDISRERIIFFD